jgi:acetoin utilization protein AcuB
MTRSPISVDADAEIRIAAALMKLNGFHHLPVTRKGELLGIVSARDLFMVDGALAATSDVPRIEAVARTDLYTVRSAAPLGEVIHEMLRRGIGSAVVTEDGEAVGIFTVSDALRAFADFLARKTV